MWTKMTFQNSLGSYDTLTEVKRGRGWLCETGHAEVYADGFVAMQGRVEAAMKVCLSLHCYRKQWPLFSQTFLVICQVGCTNCMDMALLSTACNIKVSSRAMKPGTWSGILELSAVASVLYQPVRAVYSKRFGLATQIHGYVYQP